MRGSKQAKESLREGKELKATTPNIRTTFNQNERRIPPKNGRKQPLTSFPASLRYLR